AARLIRVRVLLAVGIYTVFVGLAVLLERAYHPERGNSLLHIFFVEMGICAVGVVTTRISRLAPWTRLIAVAGASALLLTMIHYNVAVHGLAERCAMFQVSVLTGLCVLLPWGWRSQVVAVAVSFAGFAQAAPHLVPGDALVYCLLALVSGGASSICGALFLERYRPAAFL